MWRVLLVISMITPPLMVTIEGLRARKLPRPEGIIRVERAFFISIFVEVALFSVTGVMGFFDFVDRFREPFNRIVLFSPIALSVLAAAFVSALMEGDVENSRRADLLKALLLALAVVFLLAMAFVVIPNLFPTGLDIIVSLALMLAVAEAFSRIIRRVEGGRPLEGELRKNVEEFCRKAGVDVDGIYLIEDDEINAFVTGAKGKTVFVTRGALENLGRDELLAIIAHELGHVKGRHMLKGYTFAILSLVPMAIVAKIGDRLPEMVLTICVVLSFVVLIGGIIYRLARFNLKHEFEADEFAAKLVGADAMIRALKKISEHGEIPEETPKWFNVINAHPSIRERVERLSALSRKEDV